jgi:hypothetical protein
MKSVLQMNTTMIRWMIGWCALVGNGASGWIFLPPSAHSRTATTSSPSSSSSRFLVHGSSTPTKSTTTSTTILRMGLLDSLSNFLHDREGDFVRLESTTGTEGESFGPGPALLLYNVPSGLLDEELIDMLEDGAPVATERGISLARLRTSDATPVLDQSLQDALEQVVATAGHYKNNDSKTNPEIMSTDAGILASVPVLFFSGFSNAEMMASYNIIGEEIYQEVGGQVTAACAKAVPNAMNKPLRQVLDEISGDHQDAMRQDAVGKDNL